MLDALDTGGVRVSDHEASPPPLGSLLVERGLITDEQLEYALAEQERTGLPLGQVLIGLSYVTAATIAQALATQAGGVVKTEFGLSTGFGTPGLLSMPPVSPPATVSKPAWIPEHEEQAKVAEVVPLPAPVLPAGPDPELEPVSPSATVSEPAWIPEHEDLAKVAEVVPLPAPVAPAGPDPELEAARTRIVELEIELASAGSANTGRIEELERALADARTELGRIPALEVDLAAARQAELERDLVPAGPDPELEAARTRIAELEMELATAISANAGRIDELERALADARTELGRIPALEVDLAAARRAELERDAHARELEQARAELATVTQNFTMAYERLQQYELAWAQQQAQQQSQQPRTVSPFAWQP